MDVFKECAIAIFLLFITGVASYIGVCVKNLYKKYIDDKIKVDVVNTCVRAIEQIYTDIHGDEKLDKCVDYVKSMLESKGIDITHFEARMLIESSVNSFNDGFSKD